jgi:hypothetical protein
MMDNNPYFYFGHTIKEYRAKEADRWREVLARRKKVVQMKKMGS